MINTENLKTWILIGMAFGIGFLNKYSMVFLSFSVFVGLFVSGNRRYLSGRWLWFGVMATFIIFLPNLIWQYQNQFPVIDHMHALGTDINEEFSIFKFIWEQVIILGPLNLPLWLLGIYFYFSNVGRNYNILVWIFIIPFIIFSFTGAKSYYLSPAFPLLFAGSAVLIEYLLNKYQKLYIKKYILAALVISFLLTLPIWLPILTIEKSKEYGLMEFRYDYREMIGWEEMVKTIADAYNLLSDEEKQKATIFAGNYGQAGAINHFGKFYHLPKATSGIVSYHTWGPDVNADIYIIIGGYPQQYLEQYFEEVTEAGVIKNLYDIENEEYNQAFHICKRLKRPISEIWPEFRHF
jgi:hypothetical protein